MSNVGGPPVPRRHIQEHDKHLHQIYDILIISSSYVGHR